MASFRIRRVYDDVIPANRKALSEVAQILRQQFDELPRQEIESLGEKLRNPFKVGFRPLLFVGQNRSDKVLGFALVHHDPENHFLYLEYVAAAQGLSGRGIGGALYERVRDEAVALGCRCVLFECLPDDQPADKAPAVVKANRARLRFYEAFGARPVIGTRYQDPIGDEEPSDMPFLVLDPLGRDLLPSEAFLARAVRVILERKYAELCPPEYVDRVARSFRRGQVALRPFRYRKRPPAPPTGRSLAEPIPLVVNDRHEIHHVRERGYVEAPVRIRRILDSLGPTNWFEAVAPKRHPIDAITAVHDPNLVAYLKRASMEVEESRSLYPYIFPVRNRSRLPRERSVLAGYYCIDTFTPIHRNSYRAAKRAVDCTLTAASRILSGTRLAYSLVRPPGHHAEHATFGGFCYFNNCAIAAHALSLHGHVAILDIDYHHGNGQQDIFYARNDVLTVSIHGHPRFAYPYYTGFSDEQGEGLGLGYNLNLPLPERVDGRAYRAALRKAQSVIADYKPDFLVVALGLDPAKGDPTGTWELVADDFRQNGSIVRELGLPTLVVQEGGYRTRTLGTNARAFFRGLRGESG